MHEAYLESPGQAIVHLRLDPEPGPITHFDFPGGLANGALLASNRRLLHNAAGTSRG